MERSTFLDGLHDRLKARIDRAVLTAAYAVEVAGQQSVSLHYIQETFEEAGLVVPNITVLRGMLKADKRVSVVSNLVKVRPNAKKQLYEVFPELSSADEPATMSPELATRIRNTPFLSNGYLEDLKSMLALYAALHALENSMRRLIERVLQRKFGCEWWEKAANGPQKRKHADRLQKEEIRQWLPARSSAGPLYSLDWSDLISFMRRFESDFVEFIGEIDFMHRYADLGLLRHVIAHNGYIDDQIQRDRVFLALADWQKQVGSKSNF